MDLRPKRTEFSGGGSRDASQEVIRLIGIITGVHGWQHINTLTGKDVAFIKDMAEKVRSSPQTLWVNSRQLFWLRDLRDRVIT
jgi:hypothetical protein